MLIFILRVSVIKVCVTDQPAKRIVLTFFEKEQGNQNYQNYSECNYEKKNGSIGRMFFCYFFATDVAMTQRND